nr:MAG TPA: hypothetical protein [Caudoviricetes sp.]
MQCAYNNNIPKYTHLYYTIYTYLYTTYKKSGIAHSTVVLVL